MPPRQNQLRSRMGKQLQGHAEETPPKTPFRTAPPVYDSRVNLELTRDDHKALKRAAVEDDTTVAGILRGLIALWRDDPDVQDRLRKQVEGTKTAG